MTGEFYSGFYEEGIIAAVKNSDKKTACKCKLL